MAHDPESVAEPLGALLREGLAELSLNSSQGQVQGLASLAMLVARWAPRINLTGHRSLEAVARRLVLDAAALLAALPEHPGSLVDLGSGAGFPGLPIAILCPTCRVHLVEAKERKHYFQRAAVRELGLSNVVCSRGRIEELAPEAAGLVVAQALASPSQALKWALPWVVEGGTLAIPGAEEPPNPGTDPRIATTEVIRYRVPLGGPRRTLWLARRHGGEE